MRNPDFPSFKHIVVMALIYFAGGIAVAIPLALIATWEVIRGGEALNLEDMAGLAAKVDPAWISHLAPVMHAVPLLLVALYGWQRLGKPKLRLGLENVSFGAGTLAVLGTLLIANGATMIAEYLPGYENFVKTMQELLVPGIGTAIAVVISAPIMEEVVFRGIILRGYLAKAKPWVGILISGLLFGALHGLPIQVFFAAIVGFALGYVYYRTRSLGLVILIHFINNGASYIGSLYDLPTTTSELTGLSTLGVVGVAAVLTVMGVCLLYLLGRKFELVPGAEPEEPGADAGAMAVVQQ